MKLFTPAQLLAHADRAERWWHLLRAKLPAVGWRDLHQPEAMIAGVVLRGEAAGDGDTCFDVRQADSTVEYHCEVDPDDLQALRGPLLELEAGAPVQVVGKLVADLGHGTLEIHPVKRIVNL